MCRPARAVRCVLLLYPVPMLTGCGLVLAIRCHDQFTFFRCFADARFSKDDKRGKLPKWIQKCSDFDIIFPPGLAACFRFRSRSRGPAYALCRAAR